ncbi:UNVERIFIED_ORG: hypothetical protein J2X79_004647 [Arthrobacter globiformis]|nr:hypothetical protein [Arthrobacter globiformis]
MLLRCFVLGTIETILAAGCCENGDRPSAAQRSVLRRDVYSVRLRCRSRAFHQRYQRLHGTSRCPAVGGPARASVHVLGQRTPGASTKKSSVGNFPANSNVHSARTMQRKRCEALILAAALHPVVGFLPSKGLPGALAARTAGLVRDERAGPGTVEDPHRRTSGSGRLKSPAHRKAPLSHQWHNPPGLLAPRRSQG